MAVVAFMSPLLSTVAFMSPLLSTIPKTEFVPPKSKPITYGFIIGSAFMSLLFYS
ncbi:unknown [Prevotella sp. CAG:487]|nr:unknown [Prevotella sp. CAG:487]